MTTAEIIWALTAMIVVFLCLALAILASIIIHSRRRKESEARFKLLFNSVFDGLIYFDENLRIVDINDAVCELTGYSREELLGRQLGQLIAEGHRQNLEDKLIRGFAEQQPFRGETELACRDGATIIVEIGGKLINAGTQLFMLGSFRDMRDRKRYEDALKEKNIALKEVLSHIEEEKKILKYEIGRFIRDGMIPAAKKIVNPDGSVNPGFYNLLLENLDQLSIEPGAMIQAFANLTPREMEICNLIRSGASSKEIADSLSLSPLTVNKHRERIRKKLVISKKNINLASFLKHN